MPKNEKRWLIANTITWIMFIVLLVVGLYIYKTISPFPERYSISEMNESMIALGEDKNLITLYSLAGSCIVLLVINTIVSIITFSKVILNPAIRKRFQNDSKLNQTNTLFVLIYLLYGIGYCLFGFIIIIFLWINTKKHKSSNYTFSALNPVIMQMNNKLRSKKIWTIVLIALFPFALIGTFIAAINIIVKDGHSSRIRDENVAVYRKLSNNKVNVIELYFDRIQSTSWNFILMIDKIMNGKDSFIEEFPEFTSYINTISLGSLTKVSNPSIYAGPLFNPMVKDKCQYNCFTDTPNNQLTVDDWYFNALKQQVEMLREEGIGVIKYNNLPYFGQETMSVDGVFGDMDVLQEWFDRSGIKDVYTMTNSKLANYLDGHYLKWKDHEAMYDEYAVRNMNRWVEFDNTDKGVFTSIFSQQCHVPYIIKKNNKIDKAWNVGYFFDAEYLAIKDAQLFLRRLKQEPFVGGEGSVYDHSLIMLHSDHGFEVETINNYTKVLNYLEKQGKLSSEQVKTLRAFKHHVYNPVIMFKPLKYDVDNKLIHEQSTFTINNDQLLALSDLMVIVQNYLDEYNHKKTTSKFIDESLLNKIKDPKMLDMIKGSVLADPLDKSKNSMLNGVLDNRTFIIPATSDWRYVGNAKSFKIVNDYIKYQTIPGNKSMYYESNFTKGKF